MYLFKPGALKCASHPLSGTNELLSYYGSEANVDGSPACTVLVGIGEVFSVSQGCFQALLVTN